MRASKQRVIVNVGPHEIAVLIGGMPHLLLRRSEIIGVQSYIKSAGPREPIYFIEISTARAGLIVSDYDNRPLWEEILAALRDARMFDEMLGEAT